MNRKQLSILLVLVVVLGIAGLLIYNQRNAGSTGANPAIGKKLLPDLPVNDVASIAIKHGTNEVRLAKKDDLWRVRERNDYPANYSELSDFLLKMRDLKITQAEKVGPSQLPRLWLTPGEGTNSAVVVDLQDKSDKPIATLLLGKKHMRKSNRPSPFGDMGDEGWPDGRYVKTAKSDDVALVSEPLANIEPKPEQWLSKDFFKVEKVRSISVEFPTNATNSWQVSRETETGEWKLANAKEGEQIDTSKTSGLANALSSPSFSDVVIDLKPEELGLDKPTVVSLATFDDFNYTVKVGAKTNDNYALAVAVAAQLPKERAPGKDEKPEDKEKLDKEFKEKQKKLEEKLAQEKAFEGWTYLVSSWSVDSLLKERTQLLQEKKDASTNATTTATSPTPLVPEEKDDAEK